MKQGEKYIVSLQLLPGTIYYIFRNPPVFTTDQGWRLVFPLNIYYMFIIIYSSREADTRNEVDLLFASAHMVVIRKLNLNVPVLTDLRQHRQ